MTDLVTAAEYKTYKAIEHFKDDEKINALVTPISDLVKRYCGTSFIDYYNSDMVESFNILEDITELFLTESPLVSVSSVTERESISTTAKTLVENTDYYVDTEHDRIFRIDGEKSTRKWKKGFGSVTITYRAGHSETPADLKLAIFDLFTYYLKEEHKGRKSLAGASIQNETGSTIRDDIGFPDHIKRVLDMHRIVDVM